MKLSIKSIAFTLVVASLCSPNIDARGRNNSDQNRQQTERRKESAPRPNRNDRPNHNDRNHQDKMNNNGQHRPNNYQPRPNNNGHHGNNHYGQRPPQNNVDYRPNPGHGNNHFGQTPPPPPMRPPQRPNMPAHRPWQPPTPPPPAYRPAASWRPFNTILGVSLGSAINIGSNALINSGYNVTGYGNEAIYLANTSMLNMLWPDATLFYNNGGLYASEFVYSTPVYNMSRYNSVYRTLVRNYGAPVSSTNFGGSITTTWWGPGGQFINLTFQSALAGNGMTRFFTTLSFGN